MLGSDGNLLNQETVIVAEFLFAGAQLCLVIDQILEFQACYLSDALDGVHSGRGRLDELAYEDLWQLLIENVIEWNPAEVHLEGLQTCLKEVIRDGSELSTEDLLTQLVDQADLLVKLALELISLGLKDVALGEIKDLFRQKFEDVESVHAFAD